MQFQRLIIESGNRTFTLELHPHLTVIAGVGPLEREGLITELIGSLSTGRRGVHVEVVSDAGARFVVARPVGAAPRIIEAERERDVTELFTNASGQVNLLERAGLSVDSAKHAMRFTDADLTTKSQEEAQLLRLAHIDQGRLWDLAHKVQERQREVARIAEEVGSDPADAPMLAEIERRHAVFEEAETGDEKARRLALLIGANAAVMVAPLAAVFGFAAAAFAALVASAATAYSFVYWRRMEAARREEQAALDAAGAKSYLAFQLNKVNGLLSNDRLRTEMIRAAEYQRAAVAEWALLADDIDLDWALDHRSEIRVAASRLRESVDVRNPMATTMTPAEEVVADLAHSVVRRAHELRVLGAGGESFPFFIDEALRNVESTDNKVELLELLQQIAARQQVVVLTEDPELIEWARSESASGSIALVEPASATRKGHVAA